MMNGDYLENIIKVKRAEMNLTQEQLAELIGVTRKTINTIENGKFIPSTILAIKLARVFEVPVEDLFILKQFTP
ncbi:helix-turn-helix transcriptional regulator [Bacillus sp. JJ1773]|uniref:helix-turn-helix transcriptional regulator n=1 Tax=Bacillus sp. JJ1773 TaxID=3122965 RepID=UPI002FFDCAD8